MTEQHYAFIKNNIVEQIALFGSQDKELADRIAQEQGFDDAIWVGEDKPHLYSSYDAKKKTFNEPTIEYLFELGIVSQLPTPAE